MAKKKKQLDPSSLPGDYRSRIFVGGSYRTKAILLPRTTRAGTGKRKGTVKPTPREMLDLLREVVVAEKFEPILAAEFKVARPDKEIHHDALYLLHACQFAVFDLSEFSGALMEIERAADYGTRCLILYDDATGSGWRVSWMLSSFVEEHPDRFELYGYLDQADARNRLRNWLRDMKRKGHV